MRIMAACLVERQILHPVRLAIYVAESHCPV